MHETEFGDSWALAQSHPLFRFYSLIEQLKEEHKTLMDDLYELYILASIVGKQREKNGLNWTGTIKDMRNRAVRFKRELDKHAKWEESALFPLVKDHFPDAVKELEFMEQEHELSVQFIDAFLKAAERAPVKSEERQQMATYIQQASLILAHHFQNEETLLCSLWEEADEYGY